MMQSFISSTGATYLQGRSCARGHVGLAVPVAIVCLRVEIWVLEFCTLSFAAYHFVNYHLAVLIYSCLEMLY
ncbi:hypothetical protein RJ639_022012 [Escallonia herrerae]|uniref:Uncharacterized protein n=1 Tax=Escallonia herrerae TaxID=1293975 RepID=A0AA89AG97_9ASTE|nr:hypothetical protein RJ639_022012 [Escallonia herrerae]